MKYIFNCRHVFLLLALCTHCFASDEHGFLMIGTSVVTHGYIKPYIIILKVISSSDDVTYNVIYKDVYELLKDYDNFIGKIPLKEIGDSFTKNHGLWKLDKNLGMPLAEKTNNEVKTKISNLLDALEKGYTLESLTDSEKHMIENTKTYSHLMKKLVKSSKICQQKIPKFQKRSLTSSLSRPNTTSIDSLQSRKLKYQETPGTGYIRHIFELVPEEYFNNTVSKPVNEVEKIVPVSTSDYAEIISAKS